jgi:hypothetical protein
VLRWFDGLVRQPFALILEVLPGVADVPIGVDRDLPDHDELGSVVTDRLENSHRDPSRLPLR